MIRIEILFDRQSTKNLKSGTLQALQNEIEQRLKPHYPEIWLRIDQAAPRLYLSLEPATTRVKNVSSLCWKKSGRTTAGCPQHEYRLSPSG